MRALTKTELVVLKRHAGKDVFHEMPAGAAFNQASECLQKLGLITEQPWRITKLGLKEVESYE